MVAFTLVLVLLVVLVVMMVVMAAVVVWLVVWLVVWVVSAVAYLRRIIKFQSLSSSTNPEQPSCPKPGAGPVAVLCVGVEQRQRCALALLVAAEQR